MSASTTIMRLRPSRLVGRLAGLGLTIAFLVLFVRSGALGDAREAVATASPLAVAVALASVAAAVSLTALRWRMLLADAGVRVGYRRALGALLVGSAANNVVPARGGDLVRVQLVREAGAPGFVVAGTFVAERLLDGFVLAVFVLVGALLAADAGPMLLVGVALSAGTSVGLFLAFLAARSPRLAARLPRRAGEVVAGLAAFRSGRALGRALAASFALWTADVAMYGALAHGFGLDVGLGGWLLLEGIGNLAFAVPATAAGLGTFDYLTLVGARSIGVTGAGGFVLAVHALVVVPVTLAGAAIVLARVLGRRPRRASARPRPLVASAAR